MSSGRNRKHTQREREIEKRVFKWNMFTNSIDLAL